MAITDFIDALGPLAPLHADPLVSEIIVDGPDKVYCERPSLTGGVLVDSGLVFESPEAIRQVIDALLALGGVTLSPENNHAETRLPDGSRVIAVIPPTAVDGLYLVIRKADSDMAAFTWDKLLAIGTLTPAAHDLLMQAIRYSVNILVVGNNQSSGKDYILNLLAQSLPPDRRVIVLADTYELPVQHPRRIHLEPGGPAKLSLDQLLELAAKMRPDWLVIGDLAGPAAMRAVQLMNSAYRALATLYADGPEEALQRLESLCLMANPGLGLAEIRRMVASAIGLITYQQNHTLPDYRIKITRIVEVRGVENDRYVLQPLFTYDLEKGELQPTAAASSWTDRILHRLTHG